MDVWLALRPFSEDSGRARGREAGLRNARHPGYRVDDNRETHRLLWTRTGMHTAMILAAAVAVLMIVIGPAFDHHFAERQAGHGHVFLNDVPFDHDHQVDVEHAHGAGERVAMSVVATGDSDAAGIAIDNIVPPMTIGPGDGDDALQLVRVVADDDHPHGRTASPPVRPPIS